MPPASTGAARLSVAPAIAARRGANARFIFISIHASTTGDGRTPTGFARQKRQKKRETDATDA
jgi:hypothetical protein